MDFSGFSKDSRTCRRPERGGGPASKTIAFRNIQETGHNCRVKTLLSLDQRRKPGQRQEGLDCWTVIQAPVFWESRSKRENGEEQNPSCLIFCIKSLQSVMMWGQMFRSAVGKLCCLKSKHHCKSLAECSRNVMIPSAEDLDEDADSIFQQDGRALGGLEHLPFLPPSKKCPMVFVSSFFVLT